jgi:uncharacterized Zn-binding protein involved in type VI secretion
MGTPAARKGDTDDKGHTIASAVSDSVRIDGAYVAVKGSTMDDGVAITSGVVDTVRINGSPVAVVGSVTEKHTKDPNKNTPGTINSGASDVKIG